MNYLEPVEKIVRDYFDNAIIIDDQLDLCTTSTDPLLISDEDIDYNLGIEIASALEADTIQEAVPIEDTTHSQRPYETYQTFLNEGFITVPWKYSNSTDIDNLTNILKNAKLLVIDWNLEETNDPHFLGQSSLQIIKRFCEINKGMKCVVIYTKEDFNDVQLKLCSEFNCTNLSNANNMLFFQEKDTLSSLFGFVMSKDVSPNQIIKNISTSLFYNNSTSIHFIESANLLDLRMTKALTEFSGPFEKVFLTQVVTSAMSNADISRFFNETLLSNLLETQLTDTNNNFLLALKVNNLIEVLKRQPIDISVITNLTKALNIFTAEKDIFKELKHYFEQPNFQQELLTALHESISSFEVLKDCILSVCSNYILKDKYKNKPGDIHKYKSQIFLFFMLLDDYISCSNNEQFISIYKDQLHYFTQLMKYTSQSSYTEIQTGTIIKGPSEENSKFLLCITPFCDAFRLESVDNKHKFLVGQLKDEYTETNLKNDKNNCHFLAVPDSNSNELLIIKFDFYHTLTLDQSELANQDNYKNIGTLKKDYVQKIINRYIAYQSRAGVDEVFYKESSYINNFINILK
ncbi:MULTISPECIES: response regulator receiver domain [Bacillus]|uniref:response regulator receiver domain n=1 Tax=Bacillus TaxID=1386 RepID=UPI000BEC2254|nr:MULTISPECIES: response regulator receiver domain [Bacillus]PED47350.1 hypothetical protein CON49_23905 [Bacillus cereus]PFI69576.1 hypothetical protein COI82_16280 [Bacillus cereus]PFO51513.1 hypothetical protein COJ74_27070 [Bacillus cereus]PFP74951.1 hypothetical protein COJ99_00600 [Bacillus cereus]PFQ17280.1 hypothetical protein COK13_26360 [Bacillus cereus]